jgi:hypothetical protein
METDCSRFGEYHVYQFYYKNFLRHFFSRLTLSLSLYTHTHTHTRSYWDVKSEFERDRLTNDQILCIRQMLEKYGSIIGQYISY